MSCPMSETFKTLPPGECSLATMDISPPDEAAIERLFETMADAWARADGVAFASVFAEDADFTNITAQSLRGREAIARHHNQIFATVYRGTAMHTVESRVKLIHPDVATVERLSGVRMASGERRAHMLAVVLRKAGAWEIQALHNMLPFTPPPP